MTKIIWQLFLTYLRIGTFTIGGGYVMLAYVQREIVDKRHWMEDKEFMNMLALAQAAPGLIAVNTAIFVGWGVAHSTTIELSRRWRWLFTAACIGAAVLGAALPSIVIILLIAIYLSGFKTIPTIEAVFKGIRPAVVAIIAGTVVHLARKV